MVELADPPAEHAGLVLAETYRLDQVIGEGGMGVVYEASHARIERRFAVKVLRIKRTDNADVVARFKREAMIGSRLGHDHIVKVVDFATTPQGFPYIVMELLEGESLGDLLERQGYLPLEQAASIMRHVALALTSAHAEGVVHRDLKPDNIFLCRRQGGGLLAKVMDFGISKVLSSESIITQETSVLGTPFYMSPEQAEGRIEDVDHRSDIFSMGLVFYHLLAGKVPFRGDNVTSILYQVVHADPPPLETVCPELPASVQRLVHRAIQKRRGDRYQSVDQFSADLEQALGDRWPAVLMHEVRPAAVALNPSESTEGATSLGGPQPVTPAMHKSCEAAAFRSTVGSEEVPPVGGGGPAGEESGALGSTALLNFAQTRILEQGQADSADPARGETVPGTGPVGPHPVRDVAAGLTDGGLGTGTELLAARATRRTWLPATVGLVLVALAAALLVALWSGSSADSTLGRTAAVQPGADARAPPAAPGQPRPAPPAANPAVAVARDAQPPAQRLLMVTTSPAGATVRVNGIRQGNSPLRGHPVGVGALTVELRLPGYRRELHREPAGTEPIRVNASLRPLPASLRVVALHGTRSLRALVFLDGRRVDETPVVIPRVSAGRHKLRVSCPGYQERAQQVTLRPGERKRVVVVLRKE